MNPTQLKQWLKLHHRNITDLQLVMFHGRAPDQNSHTWIIWSQMNNLRRTLQSKLNEIDLQEQNLRLPLGANE